jgi:hypothetical protein
MSWISSMELCVKRINPKGSKRYQERRKQLILERAARKAKIAARGKTPLDRLPLDKRVYVAARAAGDSVAAAARAAEISAGKARNLEEDPDVQKAYQSLIQSILPASRIAELIKGGTEATVDTYDASGEKLIRRDPDWKTRRPYIEIAAEHGGYFQRKTDSGGGNQFTVVVTHVGQKEEPRTIDATHSA